MPTETKNLYLAGIPVPFDGKARFAEVEAYDLALKEGGQTFALIRHMAPVIINSRTKPANPFQWEAHSVMDEMTAVGVLEVVEAIREALTGPKVTAALLKLNGTPSR